MLKGQKRLSALTVTRPDISREWHAAKNSLVPADVTENSNYKAWWQCPQHEEHVWQQRVSGRTKSNSGCPLCKLARENLEFIYPEIARQWHPTLNENLKPRDIRPASEKKVWWQCPVSPEHVYQTSPYARTFDGSGCHFCNWTKVDKNRSLRARAPKIADEWHPARNGQLTPETVAYGSAKYVWWQCLIDAGHEWQDPISKRSGKKASGCPFCSGYYLTEKNRFSVCYPELAAEWHPRKNRRLWPNLQGSWRPVQNRRMPPLEREKNRRLLPSDVSINSHEYAWWRCRTNPDHEWQAIVADRVRYQSGCPFCTNQKVTDDNNFATVHPWAAKLWHPTRNLPLLPSQVVPGSNKMAWWRCSKSAEHVWQAPIYRITRSRQSGNRACPFCAGLRACSSNSLAAISPSAAKLWHPTRNQFQPSEVVAKSSKKAWWSCPENREHQWSTTVWSMVKSHNERGTSGCPYCSLHKPSPTNNLDVRCPALVKLWWHPTLNLPLTPAEVGYLSGKNVWWRCVKSKVHAWQTPIRSATAEFRKGLLACPHCAQPMQIEK